MRCLAALDTRCSWAPLLPRGYRCLHLRVRQRQAEVEDYLLSCPTAQHNTAVLASSALDATSAERVSLLHCSEDKAQRTAAKSWQWTLQETTALTALTGERPSIAIQTSKLVEKVVANRQQI